MYQTSTPILTNKILFMIAAIFVALCYFSWVFWVKLPNIKKRKLRRAAAAQELMLFIAGLPLLGGATIAVIMHLACNGS